MVSSPEEEGIYPLVPARKGYLVIIRTRALSKMYANLADIFPRCMKISMWLEVSQYAVFAFRTFSNKSSLEQMLCIVVKPEPAS